MDCLQAIPVPSSRAGALQSIFSLAAEKLGFTFNISSKLNLSFLAFLEFYNSKRNFMIIVLNPWYTIVHFLGLTDNFMFSLALVVIM